jgi:hypothetical protein
MSCHKIWDAQWLKQEMTSAFINTALKKHRSTQLWEQELSKMPETQVILTNRNAADEIMKQVRVLELQIYKLKRKAATLAQTTSVKKGEVNFIRACSGANCKGFLNKAWNCELCKCHTCKDCLVYLDHEDHECNPDDVATASLLARDTKPCPSCATMIHKIDGCDQMWCPDCHTPFSWISGTIAKGYVHNPHYFEYMRNHGNAIARNPLDNPCGVDEIRVGRLSTIMSYYQDLQTDEVRLRQIKLSFIVEEMYCFAALISHLDGVELVLGGRWNPRPQEFLEKRIAYLKNELDLDGFKKQLINAKKSSDRAKAVNLIMTTFTMLGKAILVEYQAIPTERILVWHEDPLINGTLIQAHIEKIFTMYKNVQDLRAHIVNGLQEHAALYKVQQYVIDADFQMRHGRTIINPTIRRETLKPGYNARRGYRGANAALHNARWHGFNRADLQ